MKVLPLGERFRPQVDAYGREEFGGPAIVTLGELHTLDGLPGFAAVEGDALLGAVLYRPVGGSCEVAMLFSLESGRGIGRALLDAVVEWARRAGMRRVWLVTTNDNTAAIRFYQIYGLALKAVHIGSMDAVRLHKPQVPPTGIDGIPLAHEFEFELML